MWRTHSCVPCRHSWRNSIDLRVDVRQAADHGSSEGGACEGESSSGSSLRSPKNSPDRINSTRRFCPRPSGVSLGAMGSDIPNPRWLTLPCGTPRSIRYFRTAPARRSEICRYDPRPRTSAFHDTQPRFPISRPASLSPAVANSWSHCRIRPTFARRCYFLRSTPRSGPERFP